MTTQNQDNDYKVPQGLLDLVSRRYNVEIIDSHYILVDDKFNSYNIMYDMRLPQTVQIALRSTYGPNDTAMHVKWEFIESTNSVRFYSEIGNNILLLLDSVMPENDSAV